MLNAIDYFKKKRALLFMLCAPETCETVHMLVTLRKQSDASFVELVSILGEHSDSYPSELYSRFKFQEWNQLPMEPISSYVGKLTADSNFGVVLLSAPASEVATTSTATNLSTSTAVTVQYLSPAASGGDVARPVCLRHLRKVPAAAFLSRTVLNV